MQRLFCFVLLCFAIDARALAQELDLPQAALKDESALAQSMPGLAKQAKAIYQEADRGRYLNTLFRLQVVAGQYNEAVATLRSLVEMRKATDPASALVILPFEILTKARAKRATAGLALDEALSRQPYTRKIWTAAWCCMR